MYFTNINQIIKTYRIKLNYDVPPDIILDIFNGVDLELESTQEHIIYALYCIHVRKNYDCAEDHLQYAAAIDMDAINILINFYKTIKPNTKLHKYYYNLATKYNLVLNGYY